MSQPDQRAKHLVPVDVDNTGEPYICRVPLLWIQLPGSTGPLSRPQWTTREHLEEMHRNWAKLHRPILKVTR